MALLLGLARPADVVAAVLTPLACALVVPLRLDGRPFVVAVAVVANAASLALPVSNLTDMLVYELLGVGFWDFVRFLALPNLVALAAGLGVLLALYRGRRRHSAGERGQQPALRPRRGAGAALRPSRRRGRGRRGAASGPGLRRRRPAGDSPMLLAAGLTLALLLRP